MEPWNAPCTESIYRFWSLPALFSAVHVYIPLSLTLADSRRSIRPARSIRTSLGRSSASTGCESFCHVIRGSGSPRIGLQSIWTRRPTFTDSSVSVRLPGNRAGTGNTHPDMHCVTIVNVSEAIRTREMRRKLNVVKRCNSLCISRTFVTCCYSPS